MSHPPLLVPTEAHLRAARRYALLVLPSDVEDAYVATAPDWPGLAGVGDTADEATQEAVLGIAEALALREELGRSAPEPGSGASGLIQIRAPRSLHRALAARAKDEGVSLNAMVNHLLTRAMALEDAVELPPPRRRAKPVA